MIKPKRTLHYISVTIDIFHTFGYQFVFEYNGYIYTAFFDSEENCKTGAIEAVKEVTQKK